MPWKRPRRQLLLCALLDLVGFIASAATAAALLDRGPIIGEWSAVLVFGLVYLLFGWLFGSYTVLRWPWLQGRQMLQRILTPGLATLLVMVFWGWLAHVPDGQILYHRSMLLLIFSFETVWVLLGRLGFRWLLSRSVPVRWQILQGSQKDVVLIRREWARHEHHHPLPVSLASLSPAPLEQKIGLLKPLQQRKQRTIRYASALHLAEHELERLPPALLSKAWLDYADAPWSNPFSFQRQLKRFADVGVSLLLLLLTSPLLLLAALLIWLEDRGPVFFMQDRSGWMGQRFRLYKLRSMQVQSRRQPPQWTVPGDQRITWIGQWLRRTRIDELPQLINVLRGEMSLIGPRPERPEFEEELEEKIPHYRKRHWMLPGLSGWAQVSAPYAASIEEAELKLSYDLYYIRHFSMAFDLLILAKTIKTVLKARGR